MFVTQSHSSRRQPASKNSKKKPCKFCQRSRWLMVITILLMLLSVTLLNNA